MTLEELQEEFPHGSRWRAEPHVRVVVGWLVSDTHGDWVFYETENLPSAGYNVAAPVLARRDWVRIPDPVPNPITEPVTVWPKPGAYVTLYPDGHYTWKGGPE